MFLTPKRGSASKSVSGIVEESRIASIVARQPHARVARRDKWYCVCSFSLFSLSVSLSFFLSFFLSREGNVVHRCTNLRKVHNVKR